MNITAYTLFTQVNIHVFAVPPRRMIAIIALKIIHERQNPVNLYRDGMFYAE